MPLHAAVVHTGWRHKCQNTIASRQLPPHRDCRRGVNVPLFGGDFPVHGARTGKPSTYPAVRVGATVVWFAPSRLAMSPETWDSGSDLSRGQVATRWAKSDRWRGQLLVAVTRALWRKGKVLTGCLKTVVIRNSFSITNRRFSLWPRDWPVCILAPTSGQFRVLGNAISWSLTLLPLYYFLDDVANIEGLNHNNQ